MEKHRFSSINMQALHRVLRSSSSTVGRRPGPAFVCLFLLHISLTAASLPPLPKLPLETLEASIRRQISEAYQNALQTPQDAEANGHLGMVLYAYELYEFADPCFARARVLAPDDERWAYYSGRTLANLGKYDQAIVSLKDAMRRDPDFLPGRLKLAECLLEAGKSDDSLKEFEAIVMKHPDDASAHYGLGRIYAGRREFRMAVAHFQKACEIFPGFGAAHFSLARVYRDLGEPEKAQEQIELYQQDKLGWPVTPDPLLTSVLDLKTGAMTHLRKGIDLAEDGQLQAAAQEHEKALDADPTLVQAHIDLIKIYGLLNQPDQAESHYRAALALNPNLAELHYNYGVLLTGRARYTEAAESFRRALDLNPSLAEAHNNYAFLLMMSGHLEEAAQEYRAAISNKPDYRAAHFNLGRILIQQGKVREAISHFLLTLTPSDEETPRCTYALAAAYARAGDTENALKYMRQAQSEAAALGQAELRNSIEKDLRLLEQKISPP